MVLIFFEIFEFFLRVRFIIYQKCPFKGQLSLVGYAQSSVPGELTFARALELFPLSSMKIRKKYLIILKEKTLFLRKSSRKSQFFNENET